MRRLRREWVDKRHDIIRRDRRVIEKVPAKQSSKRDGTEPAAEFPKELTPRAAAELISIGHWLHISLHLTILLPDLWRAEGVSPPSLVKFGGILGIPRLG